MAAVNFGTWYFAYGSNMDPDRMRQRSAGFSERRPGELSGWRLIFNKRSKAGPNVVFANIAAASADNTVEGALYLLDSEEGIQALDLVEGGYRRVELAISSGGRRILAWVYIAMPEWQTEEGAPSKDYH